SEPGKGSVFVVRLMLPSVTRPSATPARERPILGYQGPRRTILLVDDDADHRELVRRILVPLGFTLILAEDAALALKLTTGLRPDLFLLDISLPGMTGWDLARALRRAGHTAPIIMLSANLAEIRPDAVEQAAHADTLAKLFEARLRLDRCRPHLAVECPHGPPGAPP